MERTPINDADLSTIKKNKNVGGGTFFPINDKDSEHMR
jgi:hypothetical protein